MRREKDLTIANVKEEFFQQIKVLQNANEIRHAQITDLQVLPLSISSPLIFLSPPSLSSYFSLISLLFTTYFFFPLLHLSLSPSPPSLLTHSCVLTQKQLEEEKQKEVDADAELNKIRTESHARAKEILQIRYAAVVVLLLSSSPSVYACCVLSSLSPTPSLLLFHLPSALSLLTLTLSRREHAQQLRQLEDDINAQAYERISSAEENCRVEITKITTEYEKYKEELISTRAQLEQRCGCVLVRVRAHE